MRLVKTIYCLIFLTTLAWSVQAQTGKLEGTPTAKIKRKTQENNGRSHVSPKIYKSIYKKSTKGVMYGNSCAVESTRKMGFEYVIRSNERISSKTNAGKFFNNLWVKTYLVVTRSPFWKVILNKKLDECRKASGDWVG